MDMKKVCSISCAPCVRSTADEDALTVSEITHQRLRSDETWIAAWAHLLANPQSSLGRGAGRSHPKRSRMVGFEKRQIMRKNSKEHGTLSTPARQQSDEETKKDRDWII
jgi:hypothetical protein